MQLRFLMAAALLLTAACPKGTTTSSPKPKKTPVKTTKPVARAVKETVTVTVKDPDQERKVGRLELRLMEKEAQVEELQARLEDTRAEVVRTMSKLQTMASRAEAASGMAEAEVVYQSMRSSGAQQAPEYVQVSRLVRQSSAEFDKQNFGGALYLANQAKALATSYRSRLSPTQTEAARTGETAFAVPIRMKVSAKGNVRQGPGSTYDVAFGVDVGDMLTGQAYDDDWIRVSDDSGRSGYIFRGLVTRP
ncbi:MAG TPA: SH3 domain-containing protein [Gemmatimonadaceae bacterium]|nr:SH3 domain-containing protein [Gemmatimonadaceae bacterium]